MQQQQFEPRSFAEIKKEAKGKISEQFNQLVLMQAIPYLIIFVGFLIMTVSLTIGRTTGNLAFNGYGFLIYLLAMILVALITPFISWRIREAVDDQGNQEVHPVKDLLAYLHYPSFGSGIKTLIARAIFTVLWIWLGEFISSVIAQIFGAGVLLSAVNDDTLNQWNNSFDNNSFNNFDFSSMFNFNIASIIAIMIPMVIVPLIISLYKNYQFSFAQFAVMDQVGRTGESTTFTYGLKESKKITRGFKGRLFKYDLTFIGWWLLIAGLIIAQMLLLYHRSSWSSLLAMILGIIYVAILIYVSVYRMSGLVLLYHEADQQYLKRQAEYSRRYQQKFNNQNNSDWNETKMDQE